MTRAGILWGIGVGLVAIALGWQALYELQIRECIQSPLLHGCSGPLDAWVLPLTSVAAALLLVAGLWRLANRRTARQSDSTLP